MLGNQTIHEGLFSLEDDEDVHDNGRHLGWRNRMDDLREQDAWAADSLPNIASRSWGGSSEK